MDHSSCWVENKLNEETGADSRVEPGGGTKDDRRGQILNCLKAKPTTFADRMM